MSRTIKNTDLNDYFYFAEAVAYGGFAAASRVLNIPKSKLSRRISGLEKRLGVRLIARSTRHFRVTELGRSFYERCRTILEVAEGAEAIVAQSRDEPNRAVRFSCPTDLLEIVRPTLPQFFNRYPKVRLQLLAVDRPVDLVQEGVDLAIRVRTKLDDGAKLSTQPLGISRKILVAGRHLAATIDCDVTDLAKLSTLSTKEETRQAEWALIDHRGRKAKIVHDPRLRCSDFTIIRDAAAQSMGIAFLPDHICRSYLAKNKLVHVFPEWRSPDRVVHVAFTARDDLSVAARSFLDHLISAFSPGMLSGQDFEEHLFPSNGGMRDDCFLVGSH